MMKNLKD